MLLTLRGKHDELQRLIETCQRKIASLESDLSNMRAVLAFEAQSGAAIDFLPHMSVRVLFRRSEIFEYCREAMVAAEGPLDTRELARFVVKKKGLDTDDTVIRKKIVYSVMQAMKTARKHRLVADAGQRKNLRLWRLQVRPARPTKNLDATVRDY